MIHYLYRVICMPEFSIDRTEDSIHEMMGILKQERENFEKIYMYQKVTAII